MKKVLLFLFFIFSSNLFAQFYESFENTTGPDDLPSTNWSLDSGNWAVFDNGVGLTKRWEIINLTTTPPVVYSGLNSAYISRENLGDNSTSEDYLATPLVTIPADGKLRFFTRSYMTGNQGTIYQIRVSPASNPQTNASGYELVQEYNDGNLTSNFSTFEAKTIDLSMYAGQQVYVAFVRKHTQISANFGDRWIIDNVSITSGSDCSFNNNCPQSLELIPFLDNNLNGVKDLDEPIFNFGHFIYNLNNSVDIHSYNNSGPFIIYVNNQSEIYDIHFSINSSLTPFYYTNTTYNNFTVLAGSGVNTLYFPIINPNPFKDVEINIIPNNYVTLNHSIWLLVEYKNLGTEIISEGTIDFTKDINLNNSYYIVNGVYMPQGIIYNASGFTYPFTNLAPLETKQNYFHFDIPTNTTLQIGDFITNSVDLPIINDIDNSNNHSTLTQTISASYDPNEILESHGEKIRFDDFTANEYLIYTIRFENIGNANAEFIRIENTLNNLLDESTFELVTSSNEVNVTRNASQLSFRFFNINLPPSIPNTDTGHGFVQYKIKPKPGFAVGDIIPNTAEIYFDSNPPIITNTFNTEFVQSLSNADFNQNNVTMYPNPTDDNLLISNMGTEKISEIVIYEISGKKVFDYKKSFESQVNINVSDFARGIYLVEIISENKSKLTKKLILK